MASWVCASALCLSYPTPPVLPTCTEEAQTSARADVFADCELWFLAVFVPVHQLRYQHDGQIGPIVERKKLETLSHRHLSMQCAHHSIVANFLLASHIDELLKISLTAWGMCQGEYAGYHRVRTTLTVRLKKYVEAWHRHNIQGCEDLFLMDCDTLQYFCTFFANCSPGARGGSIGCQSFRLLRIVDRKSPSLHESCPHALLFKHHITCATWQERRRFKENLQVGRARSSVMSVYLLAVNMLTWHILNALRAA